MEGGGAFYNKVSNSWITSSKPQNYDNYEQQLYEILSLKPINTTEKKPTVPASFFTTTGYGCNTLNSGLILSSSSGRIKIFDITDYLYTSSMTSSYNEDNFKKLVEIIKLLWVSFRLRNMADNGRGTKACETHIQRTNLMREALKFIGDKLHHNLTNPERTLNETE